MKTKTEKISKAYPENPHEPIAINIVQTTSLAAHRVLGRAKDGIHRKTALTACHRIPSAAAILEKAAAIAAPATPIFTP